MERPENDKWLDEALTETIGSEKPRTDFDAWKRNHPQAVQMLTKQAGKETSPAPLKTRRLIMTSTIVKLAAAAVVVVAAAIAVQQWITPDTTNTGIGGRTAGLIAGPTTFALADGSSVKLADGAQIRVDSAGKRGFEHVAGQIDVSVTKGKGEFIVTSPYGQVKALGTQFTMNVMDEVAANTKERVQLLAVKVTEGSVEVRSPKGTTTLAANQDIIVAINAPPYDFNKDQKLPKELRTRIQSMIDALKAKDGAAWVANYNLPYLYKLAKGQVAYDSNLFGGTAEDAQNFQKGLGNVTSPEELGKIVASSLNSNGGEIYITSITMNEAGDHASARCVSKNGNRTVVLGPQWHHFDGGWWQVDD